MLPREIFWILTPLSRPLSWVSESFRQDDKALQIGLLFHQGQYLQCLEVDMKQGESKQFSEFQLGKFF